MGRKLTLRGVVRLFLGPADLVLLDFKFKVDTLDSVEGEILTRRPFVLLVACRLE